MRLAFRGGFGGTAKVVKVVLLLAVIAIPAVDGGSILLTRLSADEGAHNAGRAAAAVVMNKVIDLKAAESAYAAAEKEASIRQESILRSDFRLEANGGVTLTDQKVAPTLILKYFPPLADFVTVRVTITQSPIHY